MTIEALAQSGQGERRTMLRDQVEDVRKREPALLRQRAGGCQFCGQMITVEVPEGWKEEKIDELATECCKCQEAEDYVHKKRRKERAIEAIIHQFGPYQQKGVIKEKTMELLAEIADQVVEDKIQSGTIEIGEGLKAKIRMTAKGAVKVERSKTEKESKEA